ncbi:MULTISPECIES: energy-coupling factor ABC transporter permease [Clostridium]|uniref:Cobalt transport protein CbiM n=2 Tax=Clostridium TaxID=1485 RepID=D8GKE3_CLOLD|nr:MULTISPECIES: energy-coupling factor ABC transporter permease [Clostridium]ADK15283.1 predicted cobalt transport protein CbiM [Clostridium ljungdahlii DSM 13528]AGY74552.1 energy-coupling factor ABC transporter permease [Clostridium autoethanogenum DSM 10061]ALU34739.1 Cobalamin (vitamin B12) biosynthesis CbiM protein [Clostridium autoethanogenum DSM 10061]OAA88765.1 Cobalt transport protein CbiM [Clostridium ljungdahlii DSM 13528]OVY51458.1 Cobalt transport protein CbiM [Clostridium autoet
MHIEDGILSPQAWGTWYVISAMFIVPGVKEIKRRVKENLYYKPFLAMMGVAVFVISCMHFPVPVTGSCSHPCGTPLAAIVVGPLATAVISAIGLFFQAIFLGHGGITTIGANDFSMGIAGGISGYFCWKVLRHFKSPIWLAAGVAGFVGDIVTYLVAALELAISLHGHIPIVKQWMIFFAGFGPTQIPLAIGEAVFTAVILQVMVSRRPDLMPDVLGRKYKEAR